MSEKRAGILLELREEQRRRAREGTPVPAEDLFARYPHLRNEPDAALELIYHEVVLSEESGGDPQLPEYLARFPELADRLGPLFEVHQALDQIGPDAEAAVVTLLVKALQEPDKRAAAVESLGQIGPKARAAVPALELLLQEEDDGFHWAAAAALVRIGGAGTRPGVRFFLQTASPGGGKKLYDAANILLAPAAREARQEMVEAVRDPTLRDTAVRILRDRSSVPWTREQLAAVSGLLNDPDLGVCSVAAWVVHCGTRQGVHSPVWRSHHRSSDESRR